MPLPQQVQKQMEEVERIERAMRGEVEGEEPAQPDAEAVSDASDEPAAEQETVAETGQEDEPRSDESLWEQRYKSFKGHADAEMARMREALERSNAEVETLKKQIAELTEAVKSEPQQEAPLVTEKDVEAFGGDLIDLQKRVAKEVLADAQSKWSEREKQLLEKIAQLESQVAGVTQQVDVTSESAFLAQLSNVVPDWETINQDERFLAWLAEVDPMTGLPRQSYLDDAVEKRDIARVAHIFNTFKGPSKKADTTRRELERQVAPRSVRTPQTASETTGKVWTQAEVKKFYDDVVHGRVTAEEAARIESEINAAAAEGRIT